MAKVSAADKMRIQTLREQGIGARKIKFMYPGYSWSLAQINLILKIVDNTGDSLWLKADCSWPAATLELG